jgi:hypothetical protein
MNTLTKTLELGQRKMKIKEKNKQEMQEFKTASKIKKSKMQHRVR